MTANDETTETSERKRRGSKVARVIEEYGLDGLGPELESKWTGESGERRSLRQLADYVNQRLVRATMDTSSTVEGEAENLYRLLTDDSLSSGVRTHAETKIERNGTDVETLRQDFVSHQAVHTYLTKFREAELPEQTESEADRIERRKRTIVRLQDRLTAVAENTLENLCETGEITLGSFGVLVDVQVYCEDCGTQRDITTVLQRGGCECND